MSYLPAAYNSDVRSQLWNTRESSDEDHLLSKRTRMAWDVVDGPCRDREPIQESFELGGQRYQARMCENVEDKTRDEYLNEMNTSWQEQRASEDRYSELGRRGNGVTGDFQVKVDLFRPENTTEARNRGSNFSFDDRFNRRSFQDHNEVGSDGRDRNDRNELNFRGGNNFSNAIDYQVHNPVIRRDWDSGIPARSPERNQVHNPVIRRDWDSGIPARSPEMNQVHNPVIQQVWDNRIQVRSPERNQVHNPVIRQDWDSGIQARSLERNKVHNPFFRRDWDKGIQARSAKGNQGHNPLIPMHARGRNNAKNRRRNQRGGLQTWDADKRGRTGFTNVLVQSRNETMSIVKVQGVGHDEVLREVNEGIRERHFEGGARGGGEITIQTRNSRKIKKKLNAPNVNALNLGGPMSYGSLKLWSKNENSDDVVNHLTDSRSGFFLLLDNDTLLTYEKITLIIPMLAKLCHVADSPMKLHLLKTTSQSKNFLDKLCRHMAMFYMEIVEERRLAVPMFFDNLLVICKAMIVSVPKLAMMFLAVTLQAVVGAMNNIWQYQGEIADKDKLVTQVSDLTQQLKAIKNNLAKKRPPKRKKMAALLPAAPSAASAGPSVL